MLLAKKKKKKALDTFSFKILSEPKPWPVNLANRFRRYLKKRLPTQRISKYSGHYIAGVMIYLIDELIDLSKQFTKSRKAKIINCSDIGNALRGDDDFNKLCQNAIIGCYPYRDSDEVRNSITKAIEHKTAKKSKKPAKPAQKKKIRMRKPRVSKDRIGQGAKEPIDIFKRVEKRIPDTGLTPEQEMEIIEEQLQKVADLQFPFSCKVCTMPFERKDLYLKHEPNSYVCKNFRYNILTDS